MMTVGCMAHEMIHEYTEFCSDEMKSRAIAYAFNGVRENSHFMPEFMHKYGDLKKLGINAMQIIFNKDTEDLNNDTYEQMIDEDEILQKIKVKLVKDKHG